MNRTALSVGLATIVAFAAGYAVRDRIGVEGKPSGDAATVATKVAVRESGSGSDGPGVRGRAGSSSGQPQDARVFRKGGAEAWLESLKDIDSDDDLTSIQISQQCGRMDETESAELLEKCAEILALQDSEDSAESERAEDFPDSSTLKEVAGQAVARLASLSPSKALAIVKSSKDLMDNDEVKSCTFGAVAGVDPALAIAEAQALEDPSAAVTGIMGPLLAANDLVRAGLLLELCPDDTDLKGRFLEQALKSDPDLALRKGREFAVSGVPYALGRLLDDPVTRDRAVEWASAYQGPWEEKIRGDLFENLAVQDPSRVLELYRRLAPGMSEEARGAAAARIAATMSVTGGDWASWLDSLDGSVRQTALVAVIRNDNRLVTGRVVFQAAVDRVNLMNDPSALIDSTGRGSYFIPPLAVEGGGPDRQVFLSRAEELFNQMPASAEKSAQLEVLARSLMDSMPDKARLWLGQMQEGEAKAKLQREIELQAELKTLRPPLDTGEGGRPGLPILR